MLRDSENEQRLCVQRSEQFASFAEGQVLIKGLLSRSLSTPVGVGLTSSSAIIINSLSISGQRERQWACGILLAGAGKFSAYDWLNSRLTLFF